MKNIKNIMVLLMVVIVAITGCKKDLTNPTESDDVNTTSEGTLHLGTKLNADFFGQIVDEQGNALSGVEIKIGSKSTQTDVNGIFVIDQCSVNEKLAYIKANKAGYFNGSRSLIPSSSELNDVLITLLRLEIIGTLKNYSVYPNPFHDNITIKLNENSAVLSSQIFDVHGKLVVREFSQNDHQIKIKTGNLYEV